MLQSFGWQLLVCEWESPPAGSRVFTLGCYPAMLSWEVVEPLEDKAWLLAEEGPWEWAFESNSQAQSLTKLYVYQFIKM